MITMLEKLHKNAVVRMNNEMYRITNLYSKNSPYLCDLTLIGETNHTCILTKEQVKLKLKSNSFELVTEIEKLA